MNSTRDDMAFRCYRFAGVEIDPAAFVVRIDGRQRDCSRKAFELLLLLCRNPGRVLPRDEVMDALWPGGQLISDEALTQIVFRTRAVLGNHGSLLRTIRGVGLKLDAEVTEVAVARAPAGPSADPAGSQPDPAPTGESAPPATPPVSTHAIAPPGRPAARIPAARPALLGLVALLMLMAGWMATSWRAPAESNVGQMLDDGYGLRVDDL